MKNSYCWSRYILIIFTVSIGLHVGGVWAQVPPNINSGNPNFPFPQFLSYNNNTLHTLSHFDHHMDGVPHAEIEQRTREAYRILCNNMSYYPGVTVAGVPYIYPTAPNHCTCVEGDGYYLLAAAYMGDKRTFDGYYMWAHDRGFHRVTRFVDGVQNSPGYLYSIGLSAAGKKGAGTNVFGGAIGAGANSAADGDFDVALALLVAYRQWGENSGIIPPATGVEINYRTEALRYIKGLVDTMRNVTTNNPQKWNSGDIGMDGYVKGGDTWNELTDWANVGYLGLLPEYFGPRQQYVDYNAPAYFKIFGDFIQSQEPTNTWCINQFRRAEASCDWVSKQMDNQNLSGFAGWINMSTGVPVFSSFTDGEDFRTPWRTTLNHMWNGPSEVTWNPILHQFSNTSNTFQLDFSHQVMSFFKNPQSFGNTPYTLPTLSLPICGPSTVTAYHGTSGGAVSDPTSTSGSTYFRLNWPYGSFSPAAVNVQDFDIMTKMYRKCEITWDGQDIGQQYLNSRPIYFHEWFRLLGMLVLTGNYHDPQQMIPTANMKIYKEVNKTFAYVGDTLQYTITYRNYGKPTATGVVVTDVLPAGLQYISYTSSKPGVTFSSSGSTLSWSIGSVVGTNNNLPANLSLTMDTLRVKVRVLAAASGTRVCNRAVITCTNGSGWTSNEFPNRVTEVMQRNCVDILGESPLKITKTASKAAVQVGDSIAYTIVVKNQSVAFLNGGRPGVILSVGHQGLTSTSELKLNFRFWHGADEAYINTKNYRMSYFLREAGPPNWLVDMNTSEGFGTVPPTINTQALVPGTGYNHRFFLTFPDQLATVTQHLAEYNTNDDKIHRGATRPQRMEVRVYTNPTGVFNFTDDWSADPTLQVASGDLYFPVANDWTDPNNPNQPVTKIHPEACNNVARTTDKFLVEEWDGYTWRRIYGNSPASGRELLNIQVRDTLPNTVTFGGFFPGYPTGTITGGNVLQWPTVPLLLTNDSIVYRFWVRVKDATFFNCPAGPTPDRVINHAHGRANGEPWRRATATTMVSCDPVSDPNAAVVKTSDRAIYQVNDNIIYTITYENKSGGIVNGPGLIADWTALNANGKLGVTATTIDLNTSWQNRLMVYRYSHGTNGVVRGRMSSPSDRNYSILVRQSGNDAVEVVLNKISAGVSITVNNLNISSNTRTQVGTTQIVNYSNLPGDYDFEIRLVGNSIGVSIVNPGAPMPGVSHHIVVGVPLRSGFVGVGSAIGNVASISNWFTNMDSQFNVQMTDPIPTNLSFVSAATASYNAANYTGSNVAGVVTWQTIPGPVALGDRITFTWTGRVNTCPTVNIVNTAIAKVFGITPDLTGVHVATCNNGLPLDWLQFTAYAQGGTHRLSWVTANEAAVQQFVIQQSTDGIHFTDHSVLPARNMAYNSYTRSIVPTTSGTYYYRIRQVDQTGAVSYSSIRPVTVSNDFALLVQPVPFDHQTTVTIQSPAQENYTLRVWDVGGKEVQSAQSFEGSQILMLGASWSSGTYVIEITTQNQVIHQKIIKY